MDEKALTVARGYVAAAIQVLREARRPLTTAEITTEALRRSLIKTQGRAPQKTMAARLYIAVRDDPRCPIERLFEPGHGRAVRNSVRWTLKQSPDHSAG